jgi:hypothetical protein
MSDFDAESFAELDRVIALSKFVANAKNIELRARALAKLNRFIRDGEARLAAVQAQAAAMVAKAESEVKAIYEDARRRLDAAEAAEQDVVQREKNIARLEAAWRNIGEPADVMSGFRSPEYSPLQKARRAHGQSPGKDPDILGFSEPDAAAAVPIDALIRRDVGDERSDAQGNAFAPSTLTRSTEHKRGAQ